MLAPGQFLWFSFLLSFGFWIKGYHVKEECFILHKFDWYHFNLLALLTNLHFYSDGTFRNQCQYTCDFIYVMTQKLLYCE